MSSKETGFYIRVSTTGQNLENQRPDLEEWARRNGVLNARWYEDKFTGITMKRPGMEKMLEDVRQGQIKQVVCWRIDRLGRKAGDFCRFLDELKAHGVALISVREGIDFSTPVGQLMAQIASAFAQYENEVRKERQMTAINRCRELSKTIHELHAGGETVHNLARKYRTTHEHIRKILAQKPGKTWWGGSQIRKLPDDWHDQKRVIHDLLQKGVNLTQVAKILQVTRTTLRSRMRKMELEKPKMAL